MDRRLPDQLLVRPLRSSAKIGMVLSGLCHGRRLLLDLSIRIDSDGRSRRRTGVAVDLRKF